MLFVCSWEPDHMYYVLEWRSGIRPGPLYTRAVRVSEKRNSGDDYHFRDHAAPPPLPLGSNLSPIVAGDVVIQEDWMQLLPDIVRKVAGDLLSDNPICTAATLDLSPPADPVPRSTLLRQFRHRATPRSTSVVELLATPSGSSSAAAVLAPASSADPRHRLDPCSLWIHATAAYSALAPPREPPQLRVMPPAIGGGGGGDEEGGNRATGKEADEASNAEVGWRQREEALAVGGREGE
ncbi:hypothetical protein HU200_065915 [Digitaria exilis]|uniref:Uncharacterized protein n=1 Tax=Digitaria exilis TaxID=1010633 RepID=A0A834ZZA4_9POAL|nr:hypothetical protein HU200_065915 [Digitaria exilis]